MKIKHTYLFILLFASCCIQAQVRQLDLSKGNCQLFNGNLYSFGISVRNQNTVFYIYKLDLKLKTIDSLSFDADKSSPENYLQTYSDTLHDCLNIYFQKKEKKIVTVLRFNKKFELLVKIENVDIARLNNTAIFSSECFYFKNAVYSIKTVNDTSGSQFYLNKYNLKSEITNFDYAFIWQFPFERKNIYSAHIFFANKDYVLLFVNVYASVKEGQWVLKINSESGKLEKATKLNGKGETNSYQFGTVSIDKNYKSISLVGQKFTEAQYNQKETKLAISNAAFVQLYYVEIDSLGEMSTNQDFKVAINDIKTGVKKTANNYLLRLNDLIKNPDGGILFSGDIYKSMNSNLCYLYSNTTVFNLQLVEDKLVLQKNSIAPDLLVESYYSTLDKLDMNGKLCIDSLNQFEKLYYKPLTFPVKLQFKLDGEKNPIWILAKHTTKRNTVNFSFLSPVKKIYQLTSIEELNESNNPLFTLLNSGSFLISSQTDEGKYHLKLYGW